MQIPLQGKMPLWISSLSTTYRSSLGSPPKKTISKGIQTQKLLTEFKLSIKDTREPLKGSSTSARTGQVYKVTVTRAP